MHLLDTNVVSELRRPDKAHPKVLAWAASQPLGGMFISVITILELELGVARALKQKEAQGQSLRAWIDDQIIPRFEGRILPVDTAVAQACARFHTPDPRGERDSLIAATALVHGLIAVTRNTADFKASGARLFNPWDA